MIVSELARTSGVTPHAVRYYSRIGLLRPTKDAWNKYRHFGRDDIQRLAFIKKAQRLGLTLDEITQLVDAYERLAPTCPNVRAIVALRIADTEAEIRARSELLVRMRSALDAWRALPDVVPDGKTVYYLIDSLAEDDPTGRPDAEQRNKKGLR
jgi:MerR family transcriptional regulator, Zn(II)-responsive regulator of zntA